jgi:hypothetical protein
MGEKPRTALFASLTPENRPMPAHQGFYLVKSLAFRRTIPEFLRLLSFNVIQAIGVS